MEIKNTQVNQRYSRLMYLFILLFFANCNKKATLSITNNDINVYCSFNTGKTNEPEVIVVTKHGDKREIFKASNSITNISLKEKSLIIKVIKNANSIAYTNPPKEIFGYTIVLDSSANYNDYLNRPGYNLTQRDEKFTLLTNPLFIL